MRRQNRKQLKVIHRDQEIQTMFQISAASHQPLSEMADKKAHILITANSIFLTAVVSLLLNRIHKEAYLTIPVFILIGISLTAMIFAILATRPNVSKKKLSLSDVRTKKVNLLFFGNFQSLKLKDYDDAMREMIADDDWLYNSLIIDGYVQGVVLGKKYRWLRLSYNAFMFGLIAAVISFILVTITVHHMKR